MSQNSRPFSRAFITQPCCFFERLCHFFSFIAGHTESTTWSVRTMYLVTS